MPELLTVMSWALMPNWPAEMSPPDAFETVALFPARTAVPPFAPAVIVPALVTFASVTAEIVVELTFVPWIVPPVLLLTVTAPDTDMMALLSPAISPVLAVTFTVLAWMTTPPAANAVMLPALETVAVTALMAAPPASKADIVPPASFVIVAVLAPIPLRPPEIRDELPDRTTVAASMPTLPTPRALISPALVTVAVSIARRAMPFAAFDRI